jgi:hypothetical protein
MLKRAASDSLVGFKPKMCWAMAGKLDK